MIFGGGRQALMTNAPYTPYDALDVFTCYRTDNKDLIGQWVSDKANHGLRYQVVRDTGELLELDTSRTEYALGINTALVSCV